MPERTRAIIPHLITASRLVVVGATYAVVPQRNALLVTALVLLAVGTDMLDGILARRWKTVSTFGANLDSVMDFVFYASLVVWVWMWDASVIYRILPFVAVYTVLYVAALTFAKIRRGAFGFHNAWTRSAATVGVALALWTILWGWQDLFLWILLGALTADLGQRIARTLRSPRAPPPDAEATQR